MPRLTTGNGNSQHQNLSRQQRESTRSPEVQSSPSINGVLDRQYLTIGATYASKLDSSSPQSVVQPYDGTSGQAQAQAQAPIVGSINYRSGGMRLGAQNGDVWLEGNGGGVLNGLGGNFYSDKDDFSDDPSNTTTGDDSYATPPPPRHHRRLQSDDFFNFNDEEYEYLIQDFPDNHARQGVGLQANHNASSSEYDKGFNVVQKEAKGQSSEMLNIPKISP